MSCCLVIRQNNKIFLGSDSALSCILNGKNYRISNNEKKIFNIKNSLIFCSGNSRYVKEIIDFVENFQYEKIGESDVLSLSIYLKNFDFPKNDNIFNVEIIVCLLDSVNKLYQLSEYNEFNIVEHFIPEGKIQIISGGIKTEECIDLAEKELEHSNKIEDIYQMVFNSLSYESIGGKLQVWEVSNNIKKIYENDILEESIRYVESHSLVADVIVGRLLAGNNLLITNDQSSFTVSGSQATLVNADLSLTRSDNISRIILNPYDGIKIQKNESGVFNNKFYADNNGNIVFAGLLSGASGDFSGTISASIGNIGSWTINNDGLKDTYGNYIYGNGKVRLGMLTIEGNEAWFNGNIYANNLQGLVQSHQIGSVNADTINAGTIRGINIFGSNIAWPGVLMHADVLGHSAIEAIESVYISSGRSNLYVGKGFTRLATTGGFTQLGDPVSFDSTIAIYGNLLSVDVNQNNGWGKTTSVVVTTPSGNQTLSFVNGILIDPNHFDPPTGGGGSSGSSGSTIPPVSGSLIDITYVFDTSIETPPWNYAQQGYPTYQTVDEWVGTDGHDALGCIHFRTPGGGFSWPGIWENMYIDSTTYRSIFDPMQYFSAAIHFWYKSNVTAGASITINIYKYGVVIPENIYLALSGTGWAEAYFEYDQPISGNYITRIELSIFAGSDDPQVYIDDVQIMMNDLRTV